MTTPQAAKEIGLLKLALKEYDNTLAQGTAVRDKLGIEGTLKFLAASGKRSDGMERIIDDFTGFVSAEIQQQIQQTEAEQTRATVILIIANLLALVLAVFAAIFLARRISQPVAQMAVTAENVAKGDLRLAEQTYKANDEIGDRPSPSRTWSQVCA